MSSRTSSGSFWLGMRLRCGQITAAAIDFLGERGHALFYLFDFCGRSFSADGAFEIGFEGGEHFTAVTEPVSFGDG